MQVARTLSTARLALRQPQADDLSAYTAYCASDRAVHVGGPFDTPAAFNRFAAMIGHWAVRGFGRYVMEHEGRAVGHVGPLHLTDETAPELSWTIWNGADEGKGFATEAARAVVDHLLDRIGWTELLIRVAPENTGSCRIAEKLGARAGQPPAFDRYPGALTYRIAA
ncbi:GNAT family N-acetyltransferase [Roseobacter sp.]|uniref:GNAT family N-acetyltransferase n=1 Tax=Roseobacter sp. TaxID=1907202 RepID=UPI002966DDC3|nr:GNAT family N-acetyltransferase [Roseobacter sp.]MDW3183257.1 GNAT family N-acetyltransferase [Roseobacter sp.]